ncbi:MAG: FixH family protein [Bacteroidota bacterium]
MNWGIKITVLYLGFVAIILTLVITCFRHKTELEHKDYYAKEIKFQEQINASQNSEQLKNPITYKIMDRAVQIFIPTELLNRDLKGTVYFLRPSDASKDKSVMLATDEDGIQMIDPGLVKGVYKMQISFVSMGKSYYKEAVINFN